MASVYDRRMDEIRRQKEAERAGLDRIEESTNTINRGMANPFVWLLCLGALVGIPFSGGLSLGLAVIALLIATGGGKANVQAMQPTTADLAMPKEGCTRIVASCGVTVLMVLLVLLFLAVVFYNATGGMK